MLGVSPKTIIRIVVEGMYPVQYERYQWEQLTGNIKFASKVHLGARANTSVAKGTAISLIIGGPIRLIYVIVLTFRSIWGVNMGMYNEVQ